MGTNRAWGAAALAVAVGLIVAACSPSEPDASGGVGAQPEERKTHLTIAGNTEPSYSPHTGADWFFYLPIQAVYDHLLQWDESEDRFVPSLASDFTLSDDKTVLTMTLRDDVDFIDGEHLDAEGVVKQLNLLTELVPHSDFSRVGVEAEVTGEYTFEILTAQAMDRRFLRSLNGMPVLSPAVLDDLDSVQTTPVGSGPYILDQADSTPGVELNFTRNPDYWNPEAFPYDTVTVKTFDDNVAAVNALRSGQVDATNIDIGAVAELEQSGFVITAEHGQFPTLFFGDRAGELHPAIADVRVRQAINMAFDRAAINEAVYLGFGGVSAQAFTQGQAEYLEGRDDEYSYNPARARELLAEAGYPDGFDLTINTVMNSVCCDPTAVEPVVEQSLTDIGITVTYDVAPDFGVYFENLPKHPVMLISDFYVSTMNNFIAPPAQWNVWGYEDQRVSELVRTINVGSPDDSAAASRELGEIVFEEAWFAPVAKAPTVWASVPEVNVTLQPITGIFRLFDFQPAE